MNSRDVIRQLERHGWVLKRITGSHHHFVHPDKPGLATVPHPKRDLPKGTVKAIERQTGVTLRG
jgi:predicted RNA binding protein YcfA (HicA-like mRNA interferase family)